MLYILKDNGQIPKYAYNSILMNITAIMTLTISVAWSTELCNKKDPNSFSGYAPNESQEISISPPLFILNNFTSVLQQPKSNVTLWIILSRITALPLDYYALLQLPCFHLFSMDPLSPLTSCLHFASNCKSTLEFTSFFTLPGLMAYVLFHPNTLESMS